MRYQGESLIILARQVPRPRILMAAALLVVAGIVTIVLGYTWVAYVVGVTASGLISMSLARYGPQLLEQVSGSPPLRVVAGADTALYSDGWRLVLAHLPAADDLPPEGITSTQARAWLVARGAYDADTSHIQLALEGRSSDTVTITGVHAIVDDRRAPLSRVVISSPSAGDNLSIAIDLHLDENEPHAKTPDGSPLFSDHSITLGRGEVQVFKISAHARVSEVSWRLAITYLHRGHHQTLTADSGGDSFRTAPTQDSVTRYEWAWWEPTPRLRLAEEQHRVPDSEEDRRSGRTRWWRRKVHTDS